MIKMTKDHEHPTEENIYEEINSLSLNDRDEASNEEPLSLLNGISKGRRAMIQSYALVDWDFEQNFHGLKSKDEHPEKTLVSIFNNSLTEKYL